MNTSSPLATIHREMRLILNHSDNMSVRMFRLYAQDMYLEISTAGNVRNACFWRYFFPTTLMNFMKWNIFKDTEHITLHIDCNHHSAFHLLKWSLQNNWSSTALSIIHHSWTLLRMNLFKYHNNVDKWIQHLIVWIYHLTNRSSLSWSFPTTPLS